MVVSTCAISCMGCMFAFEKIRSLGRETYSADQWDYMRFEWLI